MKRKAISIKFLIVFLSTIGMYSQSKPNVIVILADDIGLGDISHYRRIHSNNIIVETPMLDKLAQEGMIFTDAHSPAALCAPSRYAILTGNHCYRSYAPWGVWGAYQPSPIESNQLTLGKLMQSAGYKTAFFGKWGIGSDFLRKDDNTQTYRGNRSKPELDVDVTKIVGNGPKQHGFDYSLTFPAGIQDVPYAVYENDQWLPLKADSEIGYISQENMTKLGVKLDKSEGLGDTNWDPHNMGPLIASKAVSYIENSQENNPFFMYYCSLAVHLPHTPSKKLNGKSISGTTPTKHLDLVKELDEQLSMLIDALKKKGIYDNTLILFTSDNGGLMRKETLNSGHSPSDIYRGGKNQAYEGGHRVPFIAWWPNNIKANSVSNEPVLGLDIMASLAGLTDQKIETNQAMDSANLLPIFLGEKNNVERPFLLTQSGTGKEVIIIENGWKLIIQVDKKNKSGATKTPKALFDLNTNPSEKEGLNLIGDSKYQEKIKYLFETYNNTRNSKRSTIVN